MEVIWDYIVRVENQHGDTHKLYVGKTVLPNVLTSGSDVLLAQYLYAMAYDTWRIQHDVFGAYLVCHEAVRKLVDPNSANALHYGSHWPTDYMYGNLLIDNNLFNLQPIDPANGR
jgi:hypothetical protein